MYNFVLINKTLVNNTIIVLLSKYFINTKIVLNTKFKIKQTVEATPNCQIFYLNNKVYLIFLLEFF